MRQLLSLPGLADLPPTPELQRELHKIGYLLQMLSSGRTSEVDPDEGDPDDIFWLWSRQRLLIEVIAARRQMAREKIVSLAAWRNGEAAKPRPLAKAG